jgi:hypothetical protein
LLDEIAVAKTRLKLPADAPVVAVLKQAARGFGCIGIWWRTGSRITWLIPPASKSTGGRDEQRLIDSIWTVC